jgi:hypothetical protein
MDATECRLRLRRAGFAPLPLTGKKCFLDAWSSKRDTNDNEIRLWSRTYPDWTNTGILTGRAPAIDIDILNPEAAEAVEELARDRFEERGYFLVRFGKPPKRAILLRTQEPFKKLQTLLIAPNGDAEQKVEILADGQQLVVAGIHPETGAPYRWHGGEPGDIALDELPYISAEEARAFLAAAVELLVRDFGYRKVGKPVGAGAADGAGPAGWDRLVANIRDGIALHDSLRDLAAKMAKAGTHPGAIVNQLRAMMEASVAPRDDRFNERMGEIPRLVDSASEKLTAAAQGGPPPAGPPCAIDETLAVFKRWLVLPDLTPVLAVLGATAANYLPGDPVWLGLIAPPSSAKTELLNSIAGLPDTVAAATMTPAGLLSGTPKKQRDKGAKGGLLQQIGKFGILICKDFGSILSMHTETRAEVMAALREIYDGSWTRHIGSDGGRTLSWAGKIGLLFAATSVIDSHYSVIGSLGDRFLFCRLATSNPHNQIASARKHGGAAVTQMRKELAESVARLFAGRSSLLHPMSEYEVEALTPTVALAVRLRGAVDRDRRTRELDAVLGAEGAARLWLTLKQTFGGLVSLGIARETALATVRTIALDSVPPQRLAAYRYVQKYSGQDVQTTDVAAELGLPTVTTRRVLEDLAAYRLIKREKPTAKQTCGSRPPGRRKSKDRPARSGHSWLHRTTLRQLKYPYPQSHHLSEK